MVVQQREN